MLSLLLVSLLLLTLIVVFPLIASLSNRHLNSFDWSGYSVASDSNSPQPLVKGINASWTVPTVKVSLGNSYSAVWIGVGGQFDDTLIQAGTEQDSINGQTQYSAWYELLPSDAVPINSLSVSPGDQVMTSISLLNSATNTWYIELKDVTRGESFTKSLVYDSSMLSAEWIVERPTLGNRIQTLADFGEVAFTNCTATLDGKAGALGSFPSTQVIMYNRQNAMLATVSLLDSGGSSFTVKYQG